MTRTRPQSQARPPSTRPTSTRATTRSATARSSSRGRRPRLTPLRVSLAVALVAGAALIALALIRRDDRWVPLLATGTIVLGVALAGVAVIGAVTTYRAAQDGRGGTALVAALVGGFAGMLSFAAFAAAVVLALLWRTALT